jgi:hypothetical protein
MTPTTKVFLGILFCLFYIPGYFFLFKEIGNEDYSLPSVFIGLFFTLFGIVGHLALIFEKQCQKFERNRRQVNNVKYFFKVLGTFTFLSLGVALIYAMLFQKSDKIEVQDLEYFAGTLSQKPKFEQGAKSSTKLNLYINELPELIFQPRYNKY